MFWQMTATILYLLGCIMAAVNIRLADLTLKNLAPPVVAQFMWVALWPAIAIIYGIGISPWEKSR